MEDAAHRLGSGNLIARAPAGGSDEVAADRARRQLLADVSHELNTPVTAMRGYLDTLSMPELTLDASTRVRYLATVERHGARVPSGVCRAGRSSRSRA